MRKAPGMFRGRPQNPGVAQIHDGPVLSSVEFVFNSSTVMRPIRNWRMKRCRATNLYEDVSDQRPSERTSSRRPGSRMLGDALNLSAESVAEPRNVPAHRSEPPAVESRNRRSRMWKIPATAARRAQTRKKLRYQERARALFGESPSVRRTQESGSSESCTRAEDLDPLMRQLLPDGVRAGGPRHTAERGKKVEAVGAASAPAPATAGREGTGKPICPQKTSPANHVTVA